jgi:Zn-dependent peptidase ImmA (M78 family)
VALQSDEYYRGLVEARLRSLGYEEPPVSVETVAAQLRVPVVRFPLPPWFLAALVYEDGLPTVLLNADGDARKLRLALGHVLGHLLVLADDATASYPKDTVPVHREADLIAEEFEMPAYMVREQAQKWFNDYRYIAGLFGVSDTRMFERMRDLGLVKSRGLMWQY